MYTHMLGLRLRLRSILLIPQREIIITQLIIMQGEIELSDRLPLSRAREQLGVRCLAQEQLGSAQEVNWHLSSHRSTLHTVVHAGLEPATLWFPSQVLYGLSIG